MKKLLFMTCSLIAACSASGQSFSANTSGTATISQVLSIAVTNLSGTVSFTSVSDYANGKTVINYVTVAIKSNVPWLLSLSSPSTFTAMGGGASTNMPASSAGLRLTGSGTGFYPVNSGLAVTGNAGNAAASGNTYNIDMNFNPGFGYNGGSYQLTLLYTLTHQ